MPHFYIDTDDGILPVPDDDGFDLPDANAARRLALQALHEMAAQRSGDGDRRTSIVQVRDMSGVVVYTAELALNGEWLTSTLG